MDIHATTAVFVATVFLCCIPGSASFCSPASDYVPVPQERYNKSNSSIEDHSSHPCGFHYGKIYSQQSISKPCIKVSGTNRTAVEVMVETVPQTRRICVKDQSNRINCNVGKLYSCLPATAGDMYYEFYCDNQCGENVNFWYRVTVSKPPSELDQETWCRGRNQDEHPTTNCRAPVMPATMTAPLKSPSFVLLLLITLPLSLALAYTKFLW